MSNHPGLLDHMRAVPSRGTRCSGSGCPTRLRAQQRPPVMHVKRWNARARRSGQYRNALVFVAPDGAKIEAARENARREPAWRSIVEDVDLRQQLTQAQTSEAEREARRSREALQQSVRNAWVLSARTLFDGAVVAVFDGRRSPTGTMGADHLMDVLRGCVARSRAIQARDASNRFPFPFPPTPNPTSATQR